MLAFAQKRTPSLVRQGMYAISSISTVSNIVCFY